MSFWRKLLGLSETTPHAAPAAFDDPDEFNDSEPAPGYERYRIARQVVLLRPKEPYVRWVHKSLRRGPKYARKVPEYVKALSNKPGVPTLVELGKHSTAYLTELYEEEGLSLKAHVERDFEFFFRRQLEQWEPQDDGYWPTRLTLALFRQWFELESFDMVLDTTKV